ncbi:hypothetical protein T484DRAFT_1848667 [Baffinella frigidus]|nr:hypothetical protein T484DRAFT_1848667 [Cryptophyta sp. CCMP2293]
MLRSRAFSLARSSPQRVLLRGLAQKPSQPGGRQKPEFNAVDPSLVNVQNIAVDGDALSKAAIRQLTAGMLLLDRDRYKLARGKFAAWNGGDAHEAAWVTANAVGVALLCEGRAAAGATRLREALKGCKALSDKGMGRLYPPNLTENCDSYSDMAGLLNDLAAALLAPRLRALAAAGTIKKALNCNLSIALLFQNELPQAKEVAEHAIKAAEALDAVRFITTP